MSTPIITPDSTQNQPQPVYQPGSWFAQQRTQGNDSTPYERGSWFDQNSSAQPQQQTPQGPISKAWDWLWGIGPQYEHQGLVEQFENSMRSDAQQSAQRMQQTAVGTNQQLNDAIARINADPRETPYGKQRLIELAKQEYGGSAADVAISGALADTAKMERGMAAPSNIAAAGIATAVPITRPFIGAYYALQGAEDALTGRQEGETVPDEIQRRLGGAGTALLAGAGTWETLPRKAYIDSLDKWKADNFTDNGDGTFTGDSGRGYTADQLKAMHDKLSANLAKTPARNLLTGISDMKDYHTWRDQNFIQGQDGMWGKPPYAQRYSDWQLQAMYDAKSSVQTSVVKGVTDQLQNVASKTGKPFFAAGQKVGLIDPPPEDLMTRAVKPGNKNQGWDDAIAGAMPNLKAAEATLGHPVQGLDDAIDALGIAKKQIWQRYEQKLSAASQAGATIDGNSIADAMMNSIDKRTALQNPNLADKVKSVADTYRRDIPVGEAEDFLQSVNRDLTTYYQKNKVGRAAAEADPSTAYTVAEGDALRNALYDKFNELTGSGAKDLKQQYGNLLNVEREMLNRRNVAARQQPDSLSEQIATARGYGQIAKGLANFQFGDVIQGVAGKAAASWLKDRNTTDSMITRAFAKASPAQAPVPQAQAPIRGQLPAGPIVLPASQEPITPGLEGILPAQRIIGRDPVTGRMKVFYGSDTGPTLYQNAPQR